MFDAKNAAAGKYSRKEILKLIAYMGPALIVSIAYIDPGNFASDIESGATTGYVLLWAVWLAGMMAMLLQYLSGKLGLATGNSLPELISASLKKRKYILPYWLGAEAAAAAVDLAEFLGTVLALNLLFGVPYLEATYIAVFDVFLMIYLSQKGFRKLEKAFFLFVGMIGVSYVYELFLVKPDLHSAVYYSVVPSVHQAYIVLIVSIIGATIMPHVLFYHSDLVRQKLKSNDIETKRATLSYHRKDTIIFLGAASLVNAAMLIMAAGGFHARGLNDVQTINNAYFTLVPLFGKVAGYVFVAALLSSGISASTLGTLAGQSVMEGMLGRKINPWKRRLVTRFVNVIPTTIAILIGLNPFFILFYSQVILSVMIPLPMIPLIIYTSQKSKMGEFVNRKYTVVLAAAAALVIIAFNAYYLLSL